MLVISLKFSASHLPEKTHCNVAFSPILALGLFFQIALEVTVSLFSTKKESKMPFWDYEVFVYKHAYLNWWSGDPSSPLLQYIEFLLLPTCI